MKFALLCLMAALQVLDVVSTRIALAHGAIEANPLFGFGSSPSMTRIVIAKVVSVLLFAIIVKRVKTLRVPVVVCAIFGVIVAINFSNLLF